MSIPPIWCEARCHYGHVLETVNIFGRTACQETAPGEFGYRNAIASARAAGWKVIRGEWCCPTCQKAMEN